MNVHAYTSRSVCTKACSKHIYAIAKEQNALIHKIRPGSVKPSLQEWTYCVSKTCRWEKKIWRICQCQVSFPAQHYRKLQVPDHRLSNCSPIFSLPNARNCPYHLDSTSTHCKSAQTKTLATFHGTGTPKDTTRSSRCWMRTSLIALLAFSAKWVICLSKEEKKKRSANLVFIYVTVSDDGQ